MSDQTLHKVIYEAPEAVHAKSAGTSMVTTTDGKLFLTFLEDRLKIEESHDGNVNSKLALAAVCTISMNKDQAELLMNNLKDLLEGM